VSEGRWHADETRWLVFAEPEVKPSPRWYLWVFISATTVVYRAEPTRSAEVPKDHFGKDAEGILSVDRYAAYKVLLNDQEVRIILAFCWAHVRRDFLSLAKDWPEQQQWGFDWVNRIGKLYGLNRARLAALEAPEDDPGAVEQTQAKLNEAVGQMRKECEAQLADPNLHGACRKVLESLKRHWSGLVIFVTHPEVAMDNSEAERKLRGPVVGRKNYYGSGSLWSAVLTVVLFSLFQTLLIWNFNVRLWLSAYLGACAQAGGRAPPNPENWLPWNMDEAGRRRFERPAPTSQDTS
jgi:transposase